MKPRCQTSLIQNYLIHLTPFDFLAWKIVIRVTTVRQAPLRRPGHLKQTCTRAIHAGYSIKPRSASPRMRQAISIGTFRIWHHPDLKNEREIVA